MQGPDERAWVERTLPDARQPAGGVRAGDGRPRRRPGHCGWSRALSEVAHVRGGYEAADWAERALELAPVGPSALRRRRRCGGSRRVERRATSHGPGRLAARGRGGSPRRGTARTAYPGDVAGRRRAVRGRRRAALRHYTARWPAARRDDDPIRLVWTLYYVAICHAVGRDPELGIPAAEESLAVAEATANPTARSMARYALGLVLKKSDPDRALALFDEAARPGGVGAQLLVAGHRPDGGGGHPRRPRGRGWPPPGPHSASSTTGTGSATGPSSGSTCATSSGCWCGSAATRTPSSCTAVCSRPGSPHRWTPNGRPAPDPIGDGALRRRGARRRGMSGAAAVEYARSALRRGD